MERLHIRRILQICYERLWGYSRGAEESTFEEDEDKQTILITSHSKTVIAKFRALIKLYSWI